MKTIFIFFKMVLIRNKIEINILYKLKQIKNIRKLVNRKKS